MNPELPSSMYQMINDQKGEHRGCEAVRVTFYPNHVQELEFKVKGKMEWLTPSQYSNYRDELVLKGKIETENNAAVGWVKKLASRCLIFLPVCDVDTAKKLAAIQAPPSVREIMGKDQKSYAMEFSDPDAVVKHWKDAYATSTRMESILAYVTSLGVNPDTHMKQFGELYDGMVARGEKRKKKAEAKANAPSSAQGDGGGKPPPPPPGASSEDSKDPVLLTGFPADPIVAAKLVGQMYEAYIKPNALSRTRWKEQFKTEPGFKGSSNQLLKFIDHLLDVDQREGVEKMSKETFAAHVANEVAQAQST